MPFAPFDISDNNQKRVDNILEVVMAYARLDFTKKTEVIGNNDVLDAIGSGLNMLGEELENSTVSLKEKEQLLKEVHHRVKNNLQIVSSLLNLQSDKILDEKYQDLITDSRNRINSMALVHEMLYSSKDLSKIEINAYVQRLCRSIHHSYSKPGSDIRFNYSVDPNLFFNIDHMISLGLIINEIISNSFKYAFPEDKGEINIELHRDKQSYFLKIQDNGIGLNASFNPEKDGNLGMQLIRMLSEQMDGNIEIEQGQGTCYNITFPL